MIIVVVVVIVVVTVVLLLLRFLHNTFLQNGIRDMVGDHETSIWNMKKLQSYFGFVKSLKPVMTEQVNK